MPEFSRFKLEVGQLFWDGGSTSYWSVTYVNRYDEIILEFKKIEIVR